MAITPRQRNPATVLAGAGLCVVAFGTLMGLRGQLVQPWAKTLVAAFAGAFLGIGMALVAAYRLKRK